MGLEATQQVLLLGFLVAVVMGAVANKTGFCTMGAVSDWVNMGDTGRMRAWWLAIAVAAIGAVVLEAAGVVSLDGTRPPYRSANFMWARYLLGGLLFGIGMTLASGCGNKTLVRVGAGNLKSVVVLLVAAVFAYLMTRTNFYGIVFHSWMNPISPNLAAAGIPAQDAGSVVGGILGVGNRGLLRLGIGLLFGVVVLGLLFRAREFRTSFDNLLGGTVMGLGVLAGWYITGGALGQAAIEAAMFMDQPPPGMGVQSYTFINPMADSLVVVSGGFDFSMVTFGAAALAGVIVGSFLWAMVTRSFRVEWFGSLADARNHIVGGALMGIGGVLAMGCTIGQGITGFSTLAVGSMIAFGSIVLGSALTMKVQLYRMVYEGEAGVLDALVAGLADLKLVPARLRKLEAV